MIRYGAMSPVRAPPGRPKALAPSGEATHSVASGGALGDPRVFFAAERTLLAWVRTGLTVMAFGFVVARFGLFLRLLAAQQGRGLPQAELHNQLSNVVGIALVLIGVACMVLGAVQHRSYVSALSPADVPRPHAPIYPLMLCAMLAMLGIALAVYLAI
jgi:putative membrane protein